MSMNIQRKIRQCRICLTHTSDQPPWVDHRFDFDLFWCSQYVYFSFFSVTKDAIPAEERLSQLLERLESLEYRLNTESRQKSELADEVAQLREENQRLQEESATAAQQLRRFTEWFFQTIEKAWSLHWQLFSFCNFRVLPGISLENGTKLV